MPDSSPTMEQIETALRRAREERQALTEILATIGKAPSDLSGTLQRIVESAVALAKADSAAFAHVEGDELKYAHVAGEFAEGEKERYVAQGATKLSTRAMGTAPMDRAIAEKKTLHIEDITKDEISGAMMKRAFPQMLARTFLVIPLLRNDDVLGVISLRRHVVRPFSADEIAIVEAFAQQALIAIENARLFNETSEALKQQRAVSDLLKTISRTVLDLQPTLRAIVQTATRLSSADAGWLTQRAGPETYQGGAVYGRTPDLHLRLIDASRERARLGRPETRYTTGRSLMTMTFRDGHTLVFPDLRSDAELYENSIVASYIEARSVVSVPVRTEEGLVAAMVLARLDVRPFTDREVQLIETFADQAAIAIENTRLVTELRDTNVALKDATEAKSRFLATMSHELRTPLNSIIGFADVLLQGLFGGINEKQRDYLTDIRSSGAHQLALINDLLDLSKIEAGRLELELSDVSVGETIASSVVFIRERAAERDVSLNMVVASDLPAIHADGRKLMQVIVNLLTNAVKFTPAGGNVTASAVRRGSEIVISVKDTGVGIAPEDQEKLFQEFEQTRQGRSSEEGTGLGLALSKRLIDLHGGRIWIESALGSGSTFSFTIPITSARVRAG